MVLRVDQRSTFRVSTVAAQYCRLWEGNSYYSVVHSRSSCKVRKTKWVWRFHHGITKYRWKSYAEVYTATCDTDLTFVPSWLETYANMLFSNHNKFPEQEEFPCPTGVFFSLVEIIWKKGSYRKGAIWRIGISGNRMHKFTRLRVILLWRLYLVGLKRMQTCFSQTTTNSQSKRSFHLPHTRRNLRQTTVTVGID